MNSVVVLPCCRGVVLKLFAVSVALIQKLIRGSVL